MGNEQSGATDHELLKGSEELAGKGLSSPSSQDALVSELKAGVRLKPTPTAAPPADPEDDEIGPPPPLVAAGPAKPKLRPVRPRQRDRDRRGASINMGDVMAVRSEISQFTEKLDFWQQLQLVSGVDVRKGSDEQKTADKTLSSMGRSGSVASVPDLQDIAEESLAPGERAAATEHKDKTKDSEKANAKAQKDGDETTPLTDEERKKADKERRRIQKKKNIIQEIQASEELYHKFLCIMVDSFIGPMRRDNVLPTATISEIFSNIEKIAPYHRIIADQLQRRNAAEVLHEYSPYLKVYARYVNNYDHACDVVASLKGNKKFQSFLEQRRKDTNCGGLDLMSFLIMPVQRIPRYKLLLQDLLSVCREDDEESKQLISQALEEIKTIAAYINETKRILESRSKIVEIQNRMSGEFDNLLSPGRQLIHDGVLQRKKMLGTTAIHMYAFNDLLLWRTLDFRFEGVCTLATTEITALNDPKEYGFTINSPSLKAPLTLLVGNMMGQKTWVNKLTGALQNARLPTLSARARNVRRSRQFSQTSIPADKAAPQES